jgi:hypothetical protein
VGAHLHAKYAVQMETTQAHQASQFIQSEIVRVVFVQVLANASDGGAFSLYIPLCLRLCQSQGQGAAVL